MPVEVLPKAIFVEVRFQAEYFLGDFLVFPLDALQLSLALVEMQALCFEFYIGNRMAFAETARRQIDGGFLAS